MITRRTLAVGFVGAAAVGATRLLGTNADAETAQMRFPLSLTDAEWRARLTPEQFWILRKHGTERAFSSSLDRERRTGMFHCAGCARAVFDSQTKFDSRTGWPSFHAPLAGSVGTRDDNTLLAKRTEVHCAHCGGHLGHVFPDGPKPTGLRYCMNGVAMTFKPTLAG